MRPACLLFALLALLPVVRADDWQQWRGPRRDGISAETGLARGLAGEHPAARRLAAAGGQGALRRVRLRSDAAYTMGWDGSQDTVFCLDAATGAVRWKPSYACGDIVQWSGPRAITAVDDDMVFTLGQHGQLRAWDATTGAPRWAVDLPKSYQPDADYGFAWSPLVEGGLLHPRHGQQGTGAAQERRCLRVGQ